LYLSSLTSIPEGFNPTVGGDLYLSSLTSIPEGFNPTVGGYLYLSSLTSIPEGFNPTVGGDLDLSSLTSIPEGFNPTVGGDLYYKGGSKRIGAAVNEIMVNRNYFWEKNNKRYAIIDGIFCEILKEQTYVVEGHDHAIYSAKKVNKEKYFFIVGRNGYYAHAEDLHQAFDDLSFKIASEQLKKEPITADTLIDVKHYRLITGSCDMGCRDFLQRNNLPYKVVKSGEQEQTVFCDENGNPTKMKASDLLPLLKKNNAYGLERFMKLVTF